MVIRDEVESRNAQPCRWHLPLQPYPPPSNGHAVRRPLTRASRSADRDLAKLSTLGHFLKGSSATLGFNNVRDECHVIQQYGHGLTVDGSRVDDEDVCIQKITDALKKVKADLKELVKRMDKFFGSDSA